MPDKARFCSGPNTLVDFDGPTLFEENVNENEEDLIAMHMDMDKLNSSFGLQGLEWGGESTKAAVPQQESSSNENVMGSHSEKLIVRHQQSLSLDGSTYIKPELLISGVE